MILLSYISDRIFRIKQGNEYPEVRDTKAAVPLRSVLEPVLYLLYTNVIIEIKQMTMATFADYTTLTDIEKEGNV